MILEKDRVEILDKLQNRRKLIQESLKTEENKRSRAENFSARELARTMIAKLTTQLDKVENAIRRIEESEYDYCEKCGNQISSERLRILPTTILCKSCAAESGTDPG